MKNPIVLYLAFVFSLMGYSQTSLVSGNVSDASGPIPAVNVVIEGTTNGTQTDFDGNFEIEAKKGDTLVFSYIGYKSEYVTIENIEKFLKVVLEEDSALLEEVVIAGYSTKKSRTTSSYSVADHLEGEAKGSTSTGNYPYGVLTA